MPLSIRMNQKKKDNENQVTKWHLYSWFNHCQWQFSSDSKNVEIQFESNPNDFPVDDREEITHIKLERKILEIFLDLFLLSLS